MIFTLSARLREAALLDADALTGLERLAAAVFEGRHFLMLEHPGVADHLLRLGEGFFGAQTRAVLGHAKAEFSLTAQVGDALGFNVLVIPEGQFRRVDPDSFEVSLSALRPFTCSPTLLLAENLLDSQILMHAGRHWLTRKRVGSVRVSCICQGAGGSQIPNELANVADRRDTVVLAITDGDYRFPDATVSHASNECDSVAARSGFIVRHQVLDVREVENLVPTSVLEALTSSENIDLVRRLAQVMLERPEVRRCGDLKDGCRAFRFYGLPQEARERSWLSEVSTTQVVRTHLVHTECGQGGACRRGDAETCECWVIPAMENKTSKRFLEWLEGQSQHKALEGFRGDWEMAWLGIGRVVAGWCAGGRPMNI
jgi:hypothetical protein